MLWKIGALFAGERDSSMNKYMKEFEEYRISCNSKRCENLALSLILLNIVLIIIDMAIYKPMWNQIPQYLYLYYSHIVVMILFSIWLTLLELNRKYNWNIKESDLNIILVHITIYWCTFMGLNSTRISGQISAYIVCMFCVAAFFYMSPFEVLFTFGLSLIFFSIGLFVLIKEPKLLTSNLINVIITIILAQICSIINYSSFVKDFLNKKSILESKLELEAANEKLNKYEMQRTDFFANISHELRTPLNVIYSAEQMIAVSLEQNNFEDPKAEKYLKMVKQNTHRLLRLINNLIDITKIDGLSFEVKCSNVDIIRTVEDIVLSVADFIESKGLTVTFDTEVEEKIIACDPDKIERILLNLLSNAVKFTDKKGDIFVRIFLKDESVCIAIKDSGIGIPEDMQERIFDRFIQVDKSFKRINEGSGIGLSLVKSLVEMHGGHISVKSKIGEGSEFLITLPDVQLPDGEEMLSKVDMGENHIERINIEFSDIYR